MPFVFFDPTMLIVLPALHLRVLGAVEGAEHAIRSTPRCAPPTGCTGREMAKAIMARNGVTDVAVEEVGGVLSDHYDPRTKKVRLSQPNYRERLDRVDRGRRPRGRPRAAARARLRAARDPLGDRAGRRASAACSRSRCSSSASSSASPALAMA